jgi:LmbE family N-acetylglucosaminyl deacetylase
MPSAPDPTALFVSPHLDDVAFSCAGVLARLAAAGWDAQLATVFTASVPDPTGFALACQLDKGLAPEVDYMALRRDEDRRFAAHIGATTLHHLPHAEAPHRGYDSADALFGDLRPDDDVYEAVRDDLARLVERYDPALLLAPQALGAHVDHRQVVRAVWALPTRPPTAWYRDAPYALREPAARPPDALPSDAVPTAVDVTSVLGRKLDAVAAYGSQLGFQFGDEDAMREALRGFAEDEAARFGQGGAAEVVRADPAARAALKQALGAEALAVAGA